MTTQPKIELKKIDIHVGLSEETPCYTARLYVDGKHFADVSNQGHGGCDMVHSEGTNINLSERLKVLESRIAETYPKHSMKKYDMEDMDESLEGLCHAIVWDHVEKRNMKSRLSRTLMTFEDGKVYTYKGKKTAERIAALAAKKPDAIILNSLSFDEAWEIIHQAS